MHRRLREAQHPLEREANEPKDHVGDDEGERCHRVTVGLLHHYRDDRNSYDDVEEKEQHAALAIP